jgi:predicted nucleic acid-binding protein
MLRVVLDTNVIVSAVLDKRQRGRPSLCLRYALTERVELVVSLPLLAEYRQVLLYPNSDR